MLTRVVTCFAVVWCLMSAEYVGAQTVIDGATSRAAVSIEATQPPSVLEREERRPPALVPLYFSLIALQVADGVTTFQAVNRHDAHEINPVMRPFATNETALFLVKASSTAGTLFAVEKLWKKNRVAAVLTMIGVNVAYSLVVANNLRALRESSR
jgi:hypothetical protein